MSDISLPDNPTMDSPGQPYQPYPADVLIVKEILTVKIPVEIVDLIIDGAEYWPRTTVALGPENPTLTVPYGGDRDENKFLLRSYPLGYIPRKHDITHTSNEFKSYITIPPTPAPDFREFSHELTSEVVSHWIHGGQIRGEFPCRKIVFTLRSHDQGWGGDRKPHAPFDGSYTWFDVGKEKLRAFDSGKTRLPRYDEQPLIYGRAELELTDDHPLPGFFVPGPWTNSPGDSTKTSLFCTSETVIPGIETREVSSPQSPETPNTVCKFHHPLLPSTNVIQRNLTADRNFSTYVITWSSHDQVIPGSAVEKELEDQGRDLASRNAEFVRNMRPGDIVTVWGKSRFPGWVNYIEEVKIEVYWAV